MTLPFKPVERSAVEQFLPGEQIQNPRPADFILTHEDAWTSGLIQFGQSLPNQVVFVRTPEDRQPGGSHPTPLVFGDHLEEFCPLLSKLDQRFERTSFLGVLQDQIAMLALGRRGEVRLSVLVHADAPRR